MEKLDESKHYNSVQLVKIINILIEENEELKRRIEELEFNLNM